MTGKILIISADKTHPQQIYLLIESEEIIEYVPLNSFSKQYKGYKINKTDIDYKAFPEVFTLI